MLNDDDDDGDDDDDDDEIIIMYKRTENAEKLTKLSKKMSGACSSEHLLVADTNLLMTTSYDTVSSIFTQVVTLAIIKSLGTLTRPGN